MDVHSRAVRSKNMAGIRSKGTKPEMYVRRTLHAADQDLILGAGKRDPAGHTCGRSLG